MLPVCILPLPVIAGDALITRFLEIYPREKSLVVRCAHRTNWVAAHVVAREIRYYRIMDEARAMSGEGDVVC